MKYAEVSSKNDSLREEIAELQVSEMKAKERSKKFKERIEHLNEVKTECLLKIENYKLKFAKVAEQNSKIIEIDEYMREKGELIMLKVALLVGLLYKKEGVHSFNVIGIWYSSISSISLPIERAPP